MPPLYGAVTLVTPDTGEVKEWRMAGVDPDPFGGPGDGWSVDSLELALDMVPTLMEAIERARMRGQSVRVMVTDDGPAEVV